MKYHNYHPITKVLLNSKDARPDPDPASKTGFHIPGHATTLQPPPFDPKTQFCRFDEATGKWAVENIPTNQDRPIAGPTAKDIADKAAAELRMQRGALLFAADVKINTLEDAGKSAKAWRTYRQALRDITKQETFPVSVVWPKEPT